jgi:uncharacterized protein YbjT (DUF2867 family)
MATVLITGASGTLGRSLLDRPSASRYGLRALSRRETVDDGSPIEWYEGNVMTGDGVDAALAGIDTVIHAASSPRRDTARTDVEGTAKFLTAAKRAGVKHFIYISIVGVDRVPYPYYEHKLAAEREVRDSGLAWSICRGTQFHDLMDTRCRGMVHGPFAVVPRGFKGQPIDVDEFADVVWRLADAGPRMDIVQAAGPEVLEWRAMLEAWLAARHLKRLVVERPIAGAYGDAWRRGDATAPAHAVGRITWRQWLERKYPVV